MKSAATLIMRYYENKYHDINRNEIRTTKNPRLATYDGRYYWVGKSKPSTMNSQGCGMSPKLLDVCDDGNCLWRI